MYRFIYIKEFNELKIYWRDSIESDDLFIAVRTYDAVIESIEELALVVKEWFTYRNMKISPNTEIIYEDDGNQQNLYIAQY